MSRRQFPIQQRGQALWIIFISILREGEGKENLDFLEKYLLNSFSFGVVVKVGNKGFYTIYNKFNLVSNTLINQSYFTSSRRTA